MNSEPTTNKNTNALNAEFEELITLDHAVAQVATLAGWVITVLMLGDWLDADLPGLPVVLMGLVSAITTFVLYGLPRVKVALLIRSIHTRP